MTTAEIQNKIAAFLNDLRDSETKNHESMINEHEKSNFDNWTGAENTKEFEHLLVKEHLDKMLAKNEFIKYEPRHSIDWQPFDPNNPPTDTKAEYLIELEDGDIIGATIIDKKTFRNNFLIISFKNIKAYTIINPSIF